MSEIKTGEHFYTKDFGNYNHSEDNFVANQELTVKITLNEYRDLIANKAKSDSEINKTRSDKWEVERQNEEFKKEIEKLKTKIFNLQNPDDKENVEEEE